MKVFVLTLSVMIGAAAAFGTTIGWGMLVLYLAQRYDILHWFNPDNSFNFMFILFFIAFMVLIRVGVAEQYKFHFEREDTEF